MWEWIENLSIVEQLLWVISIVASFIFFYQFLKTAFSRSPDKRRKHLFSRFFAFKNIAAFFSMFGWVSISFIYQGLSLKTAFSFGTLSGLGLMVVMNLLFYITQRLKTHERPEIRRHVNTLGEVLENVGQKRSHIGKIQINIDGAQRIMDAITDFEHDLIRGTKIRVESIDEEGISLVKPLQ